MMKVRCRTVGKETLCLTPKGNLVGKSCKLRHECDRLLDGLEGKSNVIIDTKAVSRVDSAALYTLVCSIPEDIESNGGHIAAFVGLGRGLRNFIAITNIAMASIPVYRKLEEAYAEVEESSIPTGI